MQGLFGWNVISDMFRVTSGKYCDMGKNSFSYFQKNERDGLKKSTASECKPIFLSTLEDDQKISYFISGYKHMSSAQKIALLSRVLHELPTLLLPIIVIKFVASPLAIFLI